MIRNLVNYPRRVLTGHMAEPASKGRRYFWTGLLAVFALLVLIANAQAQSAVNAGEQQADTDAASAPPPVPKVKIGTRVKATTEVPLNSPTTMDLDLLALPGKPQDLDISDVRLKGYVRKVEFEGRNIAQLVIAGVEKNGALAPLEQQDFVKQWDIDANALDQGQELIIEGDGSELIEALQHLSEGDVAKGEEKAEDNVVEAAAGERASRTQPADESVNFKSPEPLAKKAEKTPVISTTSTGCKPVIDVEGKTVKFTSQVMRDGVPDGNCTPSGDTASITESAIGCDPLIDLQKKTATVTVRKQFRTPEGATVFVDETCVATDPVRSAPITANLQACTNEVDLPGKIVHQHQSLQFVHPDTALTITAQNCARNGTTFALQTGTASCAVRHDFSSNRSFQQESTFYVDDGVTVTVVPCQDNGTAFAHQKDFDACSDNVDLQNKVVVARFRPFIDVDGGKTFVDACKSDTSTSIALQSDKTDCTSNFIHNIAGQTSNGTHKLFYTVGGKRVTVSGACERDDAAVFAHQTRIIGHQHDDAAKSSKPVSEIFINAPGGEVLVQAGTVLPDAVAVPYRLDRTDTVGLNTFTYTGCTKFENTALSDIFLRADNTEFAESKGPGTPKNLGDACSFAISSGSANWSGGLSGQRCFFSFAGDNREGKQTSCSSTCTIDSRRDDGAFVTSETVNVTRNYNGTNSGCSGQPGAIAPNHSSCLSHLGTSDCSNRLNVLRGN